jgi:RecA/RadA recombinase
LSCNEITDDQNFLDYVFGVGEVTEICGLSAAGKTQICFQLALNCQVPYHLGGLKTD